MSPGLVVHSCLSLPPIVAVIGFAPLLPSEPRRDPRNCQQELRVRESVGTLNLVLTRSAHLEEEVGVVCYTEADVARVGDFRVRPKNHSSLVTFAPRQTEAHCPVVVLDDELNESTEKFVVWLGAVVGPARVNATSSPLCVFLTPDSQDCECTWLGTLLASNAKNVCADIGPHSVYTAKYCLQTIGMCLLIWLNCIMYMCILLQFQRYSLLIPH